MSNSEYGAQGASNTILFGAMVAGVSPALSVPNFNVMLSTVDRIERVATAGTPGVPFIGVVAPAAAGTNPPACTITLHSSNVLDTSTYRLYFHNQSEPYEWN